MWDGYGDHWQFAWWGARAGGVALAASVRTANVDDAGVVQGPWDGVCFVSRVEYRGFDDSLGYHFEAGLALVSDSACGTHWFFAPRTLSSWVSTRGFVAASAALVSFPVCTLAFRVAVALHRRWMGSGSVL